MVKFALALLTIVITFRVTAQDVSELERRNGFKDLKLGMAIDSVQGEKKFKREFKEHNEFLSKLYDFEDPAYNKIGEIPINRIELKTYKDLLYEIRVITDKDPRLMKALESIYGLAEYDMKKETYFWKGKALVLKFKSFSRNQLELIYTSYEVISLMKDDKGKKVQDIAEDF
jgi:hypothetical protein